MCVSNRDVYWEIYFLFDFFFFLREWKSRLQCGKMTQRWVRAEKQAGISGGVFRCWTRHLRSHFLATTFPPQGFHKWMANLGRMHFTQDPAHSEPSCGLQRLQQAPQNRNGNSPSGLKVFLLNYIEFFEDFISPGTELEGVNLDIHSIHLKDWLH